MSTITEEQLAATIASTIESILKTKGLIPLDKSQQVMSPSGQLKVETLTLKTGFRLLM